MIWHVERFLSFGNLSKQLAIYSLLVYGRTKWIVISVWDFLIFSSKISPFSVWVFLHSPLHAAAKESKGGERGSSLMIRTWSRYVRTQIATGPFSSLWETIGIEWTSKRTDANALSSLLCNQCENEFKSENGLKIRVGKANKILSLWETIWIEWGSKRAGSANKGIIIIVEITIIKLCACWQCAIIMSAFCHWIGISAEWPTTTYHRELRTPINVSALCSMHGTKNSGP